MLILLTYKQYFSAIALHKHIILYLLKGYSPNVKSRPPAKKNCEKVTKGLY